MPHVLALIALFIAHALLVRRFVAPLAYGRRRFAVGCATSLVAGTARGVLAAIEQDSLVAGLRWAALYFVVTVLLLGAYMLIEHRLARHDAFEDPPQPPSGTDGPPSPDRDVH